MFIGEGVELVAPWNEVVLPMGRGQENSGRWQERGEIKARK